MNKQNAHRILDQIRSGESINLPISVTNAALERTGDIQRLPSQSLRTNGHECGNDRPFENDGQTVGKRFSWSRYLDFQTN
jgi:hypothetical protein